MSAPLTPAAIAQLRAMDTDDQRAAFITGNVVCLSVALISVALRFLSRRVAKTCWGPDDYTIVAGAAFTAIYMGLILASVAHGMGRHVWWLDDARVFALEVLSAEIFYNASIPIIKTSILLLYHRIFPQKWFNRTLLFLGIFIISYSVAQIVADIFQCVPVNSTWGDAPKEHCINYPLLNKLCGTINVLTDVVMLALPMPLLWQLNLSTARKRLLTGLFLIGGLACVGSITRLFFVDKIGNSTDPTWDYATPALIANAELCVGVLSANLPTYRPLITSLSRGKGSSDITTKATSKAASSNRAGKDSLHIPLHSLFTQSDTRIEADDEEKLFTSSEAHVSKDSSIYPGAGSNEIRVTTSFNTSRH